MRAWATIRRRISSRQAQRVAVTTIQNNFPPPGPPPVLAPDEPGPFEVLRETGSWPVLLVCDHASARIPASLGSLGLDEALLRTHIGWDIGAAAVTRALSRLLQLPAVLAGYSRLVVDCNRHLDDPTVMAETSDGLPVPGNHALSMPEREARARDLYWPYHHAVAAELSRLARPGIRPALIALHSFTPAMNGAPLPRPWQAGVLWDRDAEFARRLLAALRSDPHLVVGDNEPYSGRHPAGFTIDYHAEMHDLAHVSIEIRQDLISDAAGAGLWAQRLADALGPILQDPLLYGRRLP